MYHSQYQSGREKIPSQFIDFTTVELNLTVSDEENSQDLMMVRLYKVICSQNSFLKKYSFNMIKSHQQLNSLLTDPALTLTTTTITQSENTLELIDFQPIRQSIHLQFQHIAFLKDETRNTVECCQLGSPKLEQCRSSHFPSNQITTIKGKPQLERTDIIHEKEQLRKKLKKMTEEKGTVELIKVEWPHGADIQVSFSPSYDTWIIFNGKQTTLCPVNKQNLNENQKKIIDFWLTQTQECKNVELLKQILARFTFCGKVSGDWKTVRWYSVIQTQSKNMICEDLFDARTLVQKVGFTFARIKSVSMLNNEDQMIRTLQKLISSVQNSFCQARDCKYGRCKVYLISSSKKQVLGGFDLETLQDMILKQMKDLSCCQMKDEQKLNLFSESLLALRNKGVRLPFPFKHYMHLFKKTLTLLKSCNVSHDNILSNWIWLLKLTLYLQLKQISIEKFAPHFISSLQLNKYLSSISLEEFGPLNCCITTIYCLVSPDMSLRRQLVNSLDSIYKDLQLHFREIDCNNNNEINLKEIVSVITQEPLNKLNHFFLNAVPRLFQLKCLIRELQIHNQEGCYYKLGIILQPEDAFVNVQDNIYPFSLGSIANAYQQALNRQNHAKKLTEKADGMKIITDNVENLKNQEFKVEENLIIIDLFGKRSQAREIKKGIESVLKQKNGNNNPYYLLMIQLSKREQLNECDFDTIAESIVSNTYPNIRSIPL